MKSKTEFVNFQCDVEQNLPHPEQMCICQFIGKAQLTFEFHEGREFREIRIIELYMAIDPPTNPPPSVFQKVSVPDYDHYLGISEWQCLLPKLETAAFDNYYHCLHAVTLPSEINAVDTNDLEHLTTCKLLT